MTAPFFLGFDPGGETRFGWAVAEAPQSGLRLVARGCSDHAAAAVSEALQHVPSYGTVAAAGIDAPLFWTNTGSRDADSVVRHAIRSCGAPNSGGTVQQLNSLRGACLVQGLAAAIELRKRTPMILLTETHPKALLWLLGIAHADRGAGAITTSDLPRLINVDNSAAAEHERDAILSCYAAHVAANPLPGWEDLAKVERSPLFLVPGGVNYWMPISAAKSGIQGPAGADKAFAVTT